MTGRFLRIPWNSIRLKLVIGVLSIMLPFTALLIYGNLYAMGVVRNQVAESNKNMISLYMNQLDKNLDNVDRYLMGLLLSNTDVIVMKSYSNYNDRYLARIRLNTSISNDIAMYESVYSFFIYSITDKELLIINNNSSPYEQRESVEGYIGKLLHNPDPEGGCFNSWSISPIGDEYFLLRILKSDNMYIGACINMNNLLLPLNLINLGQKGASLFTTQDGLPISNADMIADSGIDLKRDLRQHYRSGTDNQYLVVGEKSGKGNFNLVAVIPDEKILEKLPYIQRLVTTISIVSVTLLPLCLYLLRKSVLIPLKRILTAMKRIREGDLEERIAPYKTSDEFVTVNQTFNQMLDQIRELKISVYEEQLSNQKAELERLQLQINPHFFMNSMNIIYSLAQAAKLELIKEMTLCLVQYFRFMFKSDTAFVPLRDEIRHVENYLRIQELRFPGSLSRDIEIEEYLLNIPVPPLLIQTFVENTVKYAVTTDRRIHLSIHIRMVDDIFEPRLKITVRDTGKGFPGQVLADLRSGGRVTDGRGGHIGIWNVQRRLRLLYSGKAAITFENGENPSGAVIEITLPLRPQT